jgi:hypothetical protein
MTDLRSLSSLTSLPTPLLALLYEALASSTLLRFASVVALGVGMTRCVPSKSYDEARTAAETEIAAHGRTRMRLEAAHARIHSLEQTLAERERALETGESSVAAAKLETVVAGKDKEAALELVEQLRSELARTGNHLAAFSDEKRDLARALMLAEERVRAIEAAEKNIDELVATAGALSVALGEQGRDDVEIGAQDGHIVVSVLAPKLFADGSDSLVVDATPVLASVSKVANDHPRVRVVLRAPENDKLGTARVTRLGEALVERGVAEARLDLPVAEPAVAQAATGAAPSNAAHEGIVTPKALDAVPGPVASPPAAHAPSEPVRYEIRLGIRS